MTTGKYSGGHSNTESATEQAKEKVGQATAQAQQKAKEVANQAQAEAKSMVAGRKDETVGQLSGVAEAIRTTSRELRNQDNQKVAQYSEQVANKVEQISSYLDERNVEELLADAEDFARQKPEIFLGGAFVAGLLLGRFIKSSSERRASNRNYGHEFGEGPATYARSESYTGTGRDRMRNASYERQAPSAFNRSREEIYGRS